MFAKSWWKMEEPIRCEGLHRRYMKIYFRWRLVSGWGLVLGCYSVRSRVRASNVVAGAVFGFVGLGAL